MFDEARVGVVTEREAPLLEVRQLRKVFPSGGFFCKRDVTAVRDVSFTLRRGRALAVVGESGSGKSTIARLIARIMPATSGAIVMGDVDVCRAEPRRASLAYRRRVQMVFQDPFGSLNPSFTIGYHVARPLLIHGIAADADEARARARELLATVGLEPSRGFLDRYPHELSGGQRQRVAIARAIAPEPEVLLADEPTSMLDVSIRIGILNLLERLKHACDLAVLFITHDLASARYLAEEILVMYAGTAVESGPSDDVTSTPKHPYTRLLLSSVPAPARREDWHIAAPAVRAARTAASPTGCPFAGRCPDARPACTQRMPEPTYVAPDHWVRCHLYPSRPPVRPRHEEPS